MAQSDVAQLEAQVSSGEYDVVNSATQIAQYELQLKQLLELPGDEDFHIGTAEAPADEAVLAPIPLTAEVYQAALSQRPEMLPPLRRCILRFTFYVSPQKKSGTHRGTAHKFQDGRFSVRPGDSRSFRVLC